MDNNQGMENEEDDRTEEETKVREEQKIMNGEERRSSSVQRTLSLRRLDDHKEQRHPSYSANGDVAAAAAATTPILRTRVKSVVEMLTASPVPALRSRQPSAPGALGSGSTAAARAGAADTATTVKSALPSPLAAEKAEPTVDEERLAVPAKPPRLLVATDNSAKQSGGRELTNETLGGKRTSERRNKSGELTNERRTSFNGKKTGNLSFVDSSTSPYSSDTDDPVREYPGLMPSAAARGEGPSSDLWQLSPPPFRVGGDVGYNSSAKGSYLAGKLN
jgi:hypothetical protein